MCDILLDHVASHSVPDCPYEIPVFPHLPAPQPLLQTWELAEQSPRTMTLDNPDHVPNRSRRRKRDQDMNMLFHNFHLNNFKAIVFADLLDQLFRSFPDLLPYKHIFTVFWTPDQMITGVIDRMTRAFDRHTLFIAQSRARAYADKGDFPVPLITPLGAACIHPRGKPRGILQRFWIKNTSYIFEINKLDKISIKFS